MLCVFFVIKSLEKPCKVCSYYPCLQIEKIVRAMGWIQVHNCLGPVHSPDYPTLLFSTFISQLFVTIQMLIL